jgi:hypothetical protein
MIQRLVDRKHIIQMAVLTRDNFTCQLKVSPNCRQHDHLEMHHVKPKWKGGLYDYNNLIAGCDICHDEIQPPVSYWQIEANPRVGYMVVHEAVNLGERVRIPSAGLSIQVKA